MSQQQTTMAPSMLTAEQQQDQLGAGSYYPQEPSDLTGGLPINLDSLRDGPPGTKPFYPYSTLIRYAIKGSPNQKLLLEDIYYAIESRFPYFRTAPNGWKNSVRHNLSLNPCFEKVPRPLTDRGKGSYWTVNDNVDPRTGVHRIRKKKPKSSKSAARIEEDEPVDVDYHPPETPFEDPAAQYSAGLPETGANRTPATVYPTPYAPPYDYNYQMMPPGMRFPPPLMMPDEPLDMDEHGNVDWRAAWVKELSHLQNWTEQQQKANAEQEWYRMMLYRVRVSLMAPTMVNPDAMQMGVAPQQNGVEMQQH